MARQVRRLRGGRARHPDEQAVEAGAILGTTAICASHYELFDDPPTYVEQRDIAGRFVRAAARRGLTAG
ncbi:hypothetical protein [Streptomyces sp. NPDC093260]|uniref:hypothetical protein n=1 Tax=Streptomyces sp. NPDC093260 TaxID=3155073 RepID=UPI0034213AE3